MLRGSQFRPFQVTPKRNAVYAQRFDQERLLAYIEGYTKWHRGVAPGYPEMMRAMGVQSKSQIHRAITALVEKRKLRKMVGRARALEVVHRPKPVMDVSGATYYRWDDEAKQLVEMEGAR